MKKAKIIVPAIALLALGVAGSTLGTVAWYSVTDATTHFTADSGSIATKSGYTAAEDFTVVATAADISDVILTDDTGKTYLYNASSGQNVGPVAASGDKIKAVAVTLAINYSGDAGSSAQVLALYQTAFPNGIKVTATDESNNGTGYVGNCVKFFDSGDSATRLTNESYAHEAAGLSRNYTGTPSFSTPSNQSSTASASVTFYVGIKGFDDVAQDTWQYSVLFTPSVATA